MPFESARAKYPIIVTNLQIFEQRRLGNEGLATKVNNPPSELGDKVEHLRAYRSYDTLESQGCVYYQSSILHSHVKMQVLEITAKKTILS